ncbi:phenylacetate--CoA ligase family protein [Aestuariispira insulae]|uniref:Phenylacetate-CoA ligase n=1 Tax=Aestuariispira insulae TaxID=1461337 RepID=A0A3D9HPY8_9PROT|nr:AMP-binding protein [Aestuariispira insulae]RED51542.1 phenylacetate-CoA ligase [Aestuariispira insulae]
MSDFFDALETRSQDEREASQLSQLSLQLAHARNYAPHYQTILADVNPAEVGAFEALAALPVTRKSDLIAAQASKPPFGGLTATPVGKLNRLYISPGPIADPEGHGEDWWRMGRALHAAGFRAGDLALNCFSYHHTPAGHMMETGARAVGCAVYPGGVGQTDAQVQAVTTYGLNGYIGTPDFLKLILDKADSLSADISSLKKAFVSGGALFPSMREEYGARGIATYQAYGTADLGLVAYETEAAEGMILDENVIVEIVRPGTGELVPDGEVGEVVVTLLTNVDYPLIRFATGDLSAIMEGQSPCGRTNKRIKGWMGRADQRTKIKGMFVDPAQVDRVVKAHAPIMKARLEVNLVDNKDQMVLKVETEDLSEGFRDQVAGSLQTECKLKGVVELMAPGSLPNDGKVIDDQRVY